jgi:hypothetical protein
MIIAAVIKPDPLRSAAAPRGVVLKMRDQAGGADE